MSKGNLQEKEIGQAGLNAAQVQSLVAAMFDHAAHVNVSVNYDSGAPRIEITAAAGGGSTGGGFDQEQIEDIVASLITASGLITETYDDAGNSLGLSADLSSVPDLTQNGGVIDGSISLANGTFNLNASGLYPAPIITHKVTPVLVGSVTAVAVEGFFFTPGMTARIDDPDWTLESITFTDPRNCTITVSSTATTGSVSVIFTNAGGETSTLPTFLEIVANDWTNLRDGESAVTIGVSNSDDLKRISTTAFIRDGDGLGVNTSNNGYFWVKGRKWLSARSDGKTTSFVITAINTGRMMIGLTDADAPDVNPSNDQFGVPEIGILYARGAWSSIIGKNTGSSNNVNFFSSGTPLIAGRQYRFDFENNGEPGSLIKLYLLPDGLEGSFDDETTLIRSEVIPSIANGAALNLVPWMAMWKTERVTAIKNIVP